MASNTEHGGDYNPFELPYDTGNTNTIRTSNFVLPAPQPLRAPRVARVPVGSRPLGYTNNLGSQRPRGDEITFVTERVALTSFGQTSGVTNTRSYEPVRQYQNSDVQSMDLEASKEKVDDTFRIARTPLKGLLANFVSDNATYQLIHSPHSFQKPGYMNVVVSELEKPFRIQDVFQRIYNERVTDDRFINPNNGRLQELIVQCTDRVYYGPRNSTYKRTFIRNIAPKTLRVANWPMNHLDYGPQELKYWSALLMVVKWPITCVALFSIVGLPGVASTGNVVNRGSYAPFLYKYRGYCKIARNALESSIKVSKKTLYSAGGRGSVTKMEKSNRILEPRILCFLTGRKLPGDHPDYPEVGEEMCEPSVVADWIEKNPHKYTGKCPDYVFIAYTGEHFIYGNRRDMIALHCLAAKAAREAGVEAYWIGSSCMRPGKTELEEDVCRISDVVRGANSLAIIVGPGSQDSSNRHLTPLQQWGKRLWTLPEALLSTPHRPIQVWHRGNPIPFKFSKSQLVSEAWTDPERTRQLVDHYEGTLTLSRLELVTIGLKSLFARETTEYCEGDHSYALMGLLRRRPAIDSTDSAFQALARLSLANDNDMLLERLMCIMPRTPEQHWSSFKDAYRVKLWDIYPTCQIAGVCQDGSVLVDGAFGATIHWDRFQKVASSRRLITWKRMACQLLLHGGPYILLLGIIFLFSAANGGSVNSAIDNGINDVNTTYSKIEKISIAFSEIADTFNNVGSTLKKISTASNILNSDFQNFTHNSSYNSLEQDLLHPIEDAYSHINSVVQNISEIYNNITFIDYISNKLTNVSADIANIQYHAINFQRDSRNWVISLQFLGSFLIILAGCTFISAPYLTRMLYRGKFWGTQSWLFGFEGYLDIETIECQIFGSKLHRLRWSEYGSSLSRHVKNEYEECIGVDPTTDPEVRQKVEDAITNTDPNAMRIFTLVDTNMMNVTVFEAAKPPVVVLLCAEEGGMQRAIACSYEWTTGTCYRETVLRMETPVLEEMSRVSRIRLGMKRY